jgi:uncharacterized protein
MMTTKKAVEDFMNCKTLAIVGVSRSGKKFGNSVFKDLKEKGYEVVPVNPSADTLEGVQCYPKVSSIARTPDGAVLITPPEQTEAVVQDAVTAGVKHIWMQQGAESVKAIELAEKAGVSVVSGECIMMFASPVKSVHRFHRWVWNLFGRLPE